MDQVFKALADPTRRDLLDALYEHDGQTLTELEQRSPLTRFGVMKHLRVLEAAGLITTRRSGREKRHQLNPVPIRLIHDRWVSKYAEPFTEMLSGLKARLEAPEMTDVRSDTTDPAPTCSFAEGTAPVSGIAVFEIFIKTTPQRLWEAITDPELRARYSFGVRTESDYAPGSSYRSHVPGVGEMASGENLEVDPPRRLVQSFTALWADEVRQAGASRVTWEIEPVDDSCRLTVIHDRLPDGASPQLYGGWPMVLSGLKTLLETGEDLTTPGSLIYAR